MKKIEQLEHQLKKRKRFIMYPDDYFKLRWDIFIAVLLIISVIATPLDIAFPEISLESNSYQVFVYILDILFFIDIVFTFFSAFESQALEIVDDHKIIVFNYLKFWFYLDFVTVVPLELIFQRFMKHQEKYNKFLRIVRLVKLNRLVRLVKLIKYAQIAQSDNKF